MDLSTATIDILKNFATINMSLMFNKGSVLKTISPQKTILAEAHVSEDFTREFGIYDLNEFIGVLSLFEKPKLDLSKNSLTVSGESGTDALYNYSSPDLIVSPGDKSLEAPDSNTKFVFKKDHLKRVKQGAQVLGLPELVFEAKEGEVRVCAMDTKQKSLNDYRVTVVEDYDGPDARAVFRVENMVLMPLDYEVTLTERFGFFQSVDKNLSYFIATENNE